MGRVGTDRTVLYCAVRKVDALHNYYVLTVVSPFALDVVNKISNDDDESLCAREKERKGHGVWRREGKEHREKEGTCNTARDKKRRRRGGRREGQRDSAYAIL